MFTCPGFGVGYWWIFPIIMIGMVVLCFFMMRGRMGSPMCGPGSRGKDLQGKEAGESALDILNKRYARGEVDKQGYEEKKKTITA
jgi:putative membrane protein